MLKSFEMDLIAAFFLLLAGLLVIRQATRIKAAPDVKGMIFALGAFTVVTMGFILIVGIVVFITQ